MKLHERIKAIEELEKVEMSWDVSRIFGKIELMGSQACFGENSDFITIEELRDAVAYLVDELGGTVKWTKSAKRDAKEK